MGKANQIIALVEKQQAYKDSIRALIGSIEATARRHKDKSKKYEYGESEWYKEYLLCKRLTAEGRALRTALTIFKEIFD